MIVLRDVDIVLDDGATPLSVVRHVNRVLGDDVARRIYLEARGRRARELERRALAIVPAMSAAPVDAASIEQLAAEIAQDLALTYANVYWGPVPALTRTAATYAPVRTVGEPLSDVQGAEVRTYGVTSGARTVLELAAGVLDDAPPPETPKLPPLPALIAELGKKSRPRGLRVYGSPDERAAMHAVDLERSPIERALTDRVRAGLATAIYPHSITPDPRGRVDLVSNKTAFGPPLAALGYRAGRGNSEDQWFARRSPRDNELGIFVRRGRRYGGVHASLSIGGPMWTASVAVPLAPGVDNLTVWTGDTLRRVADNVAFAAKRIEDELLAVVEPARPRGCAWYARDAT